MFQYGEYRSFELAQMLASTVKNEQTITYIFLIRNIFTKVEGTK